MFIEKLLQLMAEKKASDIFISAGSPITIKIQGNPTPVNPQAMDAEQTKKIIYEMLTPTQIETFERELELNFSKPMAGLGNFRVNCFWQKGSTSCVIRYITSDIPKMADLSLPHVLSTLIMEKRGLVLVVGATGSGKSTTLASMIDFRNSTSPGHILTMEDPVEYVFTPKKSIVNQREVGNDTKSFHDALRNAMRQAPDVILIGEIRDLETMRMALTYALSGHLCLATLHANNAYQAMNRVISFFPLEVRPMLLQDLSVSLKAVISQRLIKTLDGKRTPASRCCSTPATSRS
jgi:twitching motility protein PilU